MIAVNEGFASFGFVSGSGTSIVFTDDLYDAGDFFIHLAPPPAVASATEVTQNLAIPPGAIVLDAAVTISASPAGTTPIGDVATVRAAAGAPDSASTQLVVDFGGMRTASLLAGPSGTTITSIAPWLGTKFDTDHPLTPGSDGSFQEMQTERLLVTLSRSTTPSALASNGVVTVSSPPSDVELLVNGTQVFFRSGPAPAGFSQSVPIAGAVQGAADATVSPVPVTLRSRVAAQLSLAVNSASYLNTHQVAFPDGLTTDVDLAEEGPFQIALPLPTDAATWAVRRVDVTLAATPGPVRVLPSTGPTPSSDAELHLDPDHALVARLPAGPLGRLATVDAVRVLVGAAADGAQLGGAMRADAGGRPGDPVPGGQLGPVPVPTGAPAWVTLPLKKPLPVAGPPPWVSLQCTQGALTWSVAVPAADPRDDAVLGREPSAGRFRDLSSPQGVAVHAAMLRTSGEVAKGEVVPLIDIALGGVGTSSGGGIQCTPTPAGILVQLGTDTAVTVTTPGAFAGGALLLDCVTSAPVQLTVGPVTVAYTDGGS